MPLSLAVERPSIFDLAEACQSLSLPFTVEPEKSYPRDPTTRGRVRVQLRADDGKPLDATLKSKHNLLTAIATAIPSLKNHNLRVEVEKKREEKEMKELQQWIGQPVGGGGTAGGGGGGGGGGGAAAGSAAPAAETGGDKGGNKKKKKKK